MTKSSESRTKACCPCKSSEPLVAAWDNPRSPHRRGLPSVTHCSPGGRSARRKSRSVQRRPQRLQPAPAGSNAGERPSDPAAVQAAACTGPRAGHAQPYRPSRVQRRRDLLDYRLKHFFLSNTCHSTASRGRNSRSLKRRDSTRASPIVFTRTRGASNGGASRFFIHAETGRQSVQWILRAHGSQDLSFGCWWSRAGHSPGLSCSAHP